MRKDQDHEKGQEGTMGGQGGTMRRPGKDYNEEPRRDHNKEPGRGHKLSIVTRWITKLCHQKSSRIIRPTKKASVAPNVSHSHNMKTSQAHPPKSKPSLKKTGKRKAITSSKDRSDIESDDVIIEDVEVKVKEDIQPWETINIVDECSTVNSTGEMVEENGDCDELKMN
ncbi:hypothetical protein EDB19DRAFT_1824209 [Suillus lakei]|nr:hypothetical protein EDB19DRAFT_1824209 [Suillus lakei]